MTRAESLAGVSAKSLLNAFLAMYAKEEIVWKKDIRLNEQPGQLEPGRQLGQSSLVGYYSFVPKTWDDLTELEQSAAIKDPRLRAFLYSSQRASTAGSDIPAEGGKPPELASSLPAPACATPNQPIVIKISPQAVIDGETVHVELK